MVAMAEDFGADPRLVAFMQYVRVAAVVFSASLAARFLMANPAAVGSGSAEAVEPLSLMATLAVAVIGAGAALALRVPAGAQIGPMVLGSLLHATGVVRMALPVPLLELAYACIGMYVGLRFTRETLRLTVTALPGILVATFSVIALCAAWGWGLTLLLPIDLLTAVLATSPGGLDSVAIIAVGSKADVSFVLAVQTLRLFVVLLTGPLLAKWISRSVPRGRPDERLGPRLPQFLARPAPWRAHRAGGPTGTGPAGGRRAGRAAARRDPVGARRADGEPAG